MVQENELLQEDDQIDKILDLEVELLLGLNEDKLHFLEEFLN
jgi:hypothetical protein